MERGEVHGRWASWQEWVAVRPDWQKAGYLIHLVQYGPRIRELPNVPHLRDILQSEDERKMVDFIEISQNVGVGFYLPPGVPNDRTAALTSSFEAVLENARFLADAKKRQADVEPIKGKELERLTAKAYATPEPVLRKLRSMLGFPETF
jgi:predicted SpoU family rRNA methylase